MKIVVPNYTFVKGAAGAGTVTFTDFPTGTLALERILVVRNATRGLDAYNPFDITKLGTVATNVLTLAMDTSGWNNADKLTIVYDQPDPITKHVSTQETLVANTVPNSGSGRTLTPSGFIAQEVEISNVDGAAIVYGTLDGSTPSATNKLFTLPATPCNVVLPVGGAVTVKLISPGTPLVGYTIRGS